jgi:anti-anti-sigma factor
MIALKVEHFDQVPVARLPADVDAANAMMLAERLVASVGEHARELIVDLTHTRYLDSAGIDMLFRLGQRLADRRARLHLVIAPGSPLERLADTVALASAMPVHGDVDEALTASVPGRAQGSARYHADGPGTHER